MNRDNPIDISSDEDEEKYVDRREILAPAIYDTIAALGGYDGTTYKLGDEAYGCLKDLKKYWRKDDTDDERTVARIFWEARVLPNDLVPVLLETAGKGRVEDKCAIAVADIVTAMTWPIDLAEELKELDEELDRGSDYTQLLLSHLHYKAALLRPGVIPALLGVMLPCIAKDKKDRKERDGQIVNVVLHLFRNLAFIKDVPPNVHASSDQAEFSTLQSKLIQTMSEAHIFDLLLTMASNAASDPFFNQWNTLIMEIFYLLFRGVLPQTLSMEQTKRSQGTLSRLLEEENKIKVENARKASSRHSRFGTTISVKLNPNKQPTPTPTQEQGETPTPDASASFSATGSRSFVLHRQRALNEETGNIFDLKKRKVVRKTNKVDELSREENLSHEAKVILRNVANTFIETCFNAFLSSLLKDIKSERPKITEKDHIRLLFLVKWFLEFFLAVRANAKAEPKESNATVWGFDLVGEIVERSWIVWILKRMREAVEEKPKLWTELQAGIECLTQLLQLIDNMSSSQITDSDLNEAAELLQQQLVYNGEVLDIAVESLRSYKEGVQSLRYLDSSVRLAYTLLRMLERWSRKRGGEVYVRKKAKPKRAKKGKEGDPAVDVDEEEVAMEKEEDDGPIIQETMFSFEVFEMKFAHEEITHTLLTYLARYREFTSPEQMKRVVNLLHRQAIKAKAEGLFFKVSTMNLFKSILSKQGSLPTDQAYKDLISLINYILKKFFKQLATDPLLAVEAFFPKNRSRWKQYSSWEPEAKEPKRGRIAEEDSKFPPDVQVKKGYSWSEQLGIAIGCLKEAGKDELITWVKEILILVIGQRQRIVEETDSSSGQSQLDPSNVDGDENSDDEARAAALKSGDQPSKEAVAKFKDYMIPYLTNERADDATKNPHLKLVFRLIKFKVLDDNAEELEWYAPAAILPADLQRSLNVITQFEANPLDLNGRSPSELLTKARRRRRRRRRSPSNSDSEKEEGAEDDAARKKKRKKKASEEQVYKSAQFIEDSDAEYGDDEAFWAKEREHRERTAKAAAEGTAATMRSTGTKKRKKRKGRDVNGEEGGAEMSGSDVGRDDDRKRAKMSSANESNSSSDTDFNSDEPASKSKSKVTKASKSTKKSKAKSSQNTGTSKSKGKSRIRRDANKKSASLRASGSEDDEAAPPAKQSDSQFDTNPLFLDGDDDDDGAHNPPDGEKADTPTVVTPMSGVSQSSTPLFLTDDDDIEVTVPLRKPKRTVLVSDDEDE